MGLSNNINEKRERDDNSFVVPTIIYGYTENGKILKPIIDFATNSLVNIDFEHYMVHYGKVYYIDRVATIDTDATNIILIVTRDTPIYAHLGIILISTKGCLLEFYEDTVTSNDGTALTIFNRNRNSSNTSIMGAFHTPSVTTNGTLLQSKHVGSAGVAEKSEPGETRNLSEWILKRNSKYLLKVTSHEDANETIIGASWYEHQNKD